MLDRREESRPSLSLSVRSREKYQLMMSKISLSLSRASARQTMHRMRPLTLLAWDSACEHRDGRVRGRTGAAPHLVLCGELQGHGEVGVGELVGVVLAQDVELLLAEAERRPPPVEGRVEGREEGEPPLALLAGAGTAGERGQGSEVFEGSDCNVELAKAGQAEPGSS